MWIEKYCPVCGKDFELLQKSEVRASDISLFFCPAKIRYPGYSFDQSHFESQYCQGDLYYERAIIYPYMIESYKEVSEIYFYSQSKPRRSFVVETPYLDLPWNNLEKCVSKLKLYTILS